MPERNLVAANGNRFLGRVDIGGQRNFSPGLSLDRRCWQQRCSLEEISLKIRGLRRVISSQDGAVKWFAGVPSISGRIYLQGHLGAETPTLDFLSLMVNIQPLGLSVLSIDGFDKIAGAGTLFRFHHQGVPWRGRRQYTFTVTGSPGSLDRHSEDRSN